MIKKTFNNSWILWKLKISGDVETDKLVYVNYGRVEDFMKIKELGINVKGSIVIAKYGKGYRGNKVGLV